MPRRSRNRVMNVQALGALEKMKFEIANELGIDLRDGYNGHLTSSEAGSIGGAMVRRMINFAEANMAGTPNDVKGIL